MNKAKHTQGPWGLGEMTVIPWGIDEALVVPLESEGISIGTINLEAPYIDDVQDLNEGWANAKLIAAAPDLLKALEAIIDQFCKLTHQLLTPEQAKAYDLATRALNKAK